MGSASRLALSKLAQKSGCPLTSSSGVGRWGAEPFLAIGTSGTVERAFFVTFGSLRQPMTGARAKRGTQANCGSSTHGLNYRILDLDLDFFVRPVHNWMPSEEHHRTVVCDQSPAHGLRVAIGGGG